MKKRLNIVVPLIVVLVLSAGCAKKISESMASWVGHHQSELIAKWGPPTRETSDGAGGRVLIWEYHSQYTTQGTANTNCYTDAYGHTNCNTTTNPPLTHHNVSTRSFWVGTDGQIYRWAWRGF